MLQAQVCQDSLSVIVKQKKLESSAMAENPLLQSNISIKIITENDGG